MLNSHTRTTLAWSKASAVRTALLCLAGAVGALVYRASWGSNMRLPEVQVAEYLAVFLGAAALTLIYSGFGGGWVGRILNRGYAAWLAAAALFVGIYKAGMYQFGGWDEGLVLNAACRYGYGQAPGTDYLCSLPPLFLAGVRCAALVFGLRWSSFAWFLAGFSALAMLWISNLLTMAGMRRSWSIAVSVCVVINTALMAPFWWFNNSTAISVVLLFAAVLACLRVRSAWWPWLSCTVALGMVLASKPNVAPACLMVAGLLFVLPPRDWWRIFAVCAGGGMVFLALCKAALLPVGALLHSYVEVGRLRGSPLLMLPLRDMFWPESGLQAAIILLLLGSFLWLLGWWRQRRDQPAVAFICVMAALTSLEMACTNSEYKTSDLALMMAACAVLALCGNARPRLATRYLLASICAFFLVFGIFFSSIHIRIRSIGAMLYYEEAPTREIDSGVFRGLQAGPRLQRVLRQTELALERYPAKTVFFGPRMEFGYAVFGRRPLEGLPLLWDPGNMFSPERLPALLLRFQQHDPDVLIFLKNDFTRMGIVGYYIQRSATYRRDESFSDITVFVRDRTVPISFIRIQH